MYVSPNSWKIYNAKVIPELAEWYSQFSDNLSPRGAKTVNKSVTKGKLNGDTAVQLLIEPVFLLHHFANSAQLEDLAEICKQVPFTGNYWGWEPFRATFSMIYRSSVNSANSPLAHDVKHWLSYPDNNETLGPRNINSAMQNRLNGLSMDDFQTSTYQRPLTMPEFSYMIAKIRELYVIWAFGGSKAWPRNRIDQELAACHEMIADYLI